MILNRWPRDPVLEKQVGKVQHIYVRCGLPLPGGLTASFLLHNRTMSSILAINHRRLCDIRDRPHPPWQPTNSWQGQKNPFFCTVASRPLCPPPSPPPPHPSHTPVMKPIHKILRRFLVEDDIVNGEQTEKRTFFNSFLRVRGVRHWNNDVKRFTPCRVNDIIQWRWTQHVCTRCQGCDKWRVARHRDG